MWTNDTSVITRRGLAGTARGSLWHFLTQISAKTCHPRQRGAYFQRVAMTNAAAMPPMPIRMFQLPRSLM